MHEATVCHLLRGSGDEREVLLGKRDSLFCNHIWNGPGGKLKTKTGEKPRICLRREVREEVGVRIDMKSIRHFATMDFYHPYRAEHRHEWRVHFYQVTAWEGEPRIIEGFTELGWFKLHDLPFAAMNVDQKIWVPMTLNGIASGRLLLGDVFYGDSDMKTVNKMTFRFESPK